MLTIEERVLSYNEAHPKFSKLHIHNSCLYGFWLIGRWYASDRSFYGSYPPNYLKRIMSLFPDCWKILHLFSGTLKAGSEETTFDINPELHPDICGDAREILKYFPDDKFDLILADPPYEGKDFKVYGYKSFNKAKVIKDCWHIIKPDGFLVWMDTRMPIFSKQFWQLFGTIGLIQSTNHRVRMVTIFKKKESN